MRRALRFSGRNFEGAAASEPRGLLQVIRELFIATGPKVRRGVRMRTCCNRVHASGEPCGFIPVTRVAKSGRQVERYALTRARKAKDWS
jgi:hypothetical protein